MLELTLAFALVVAGAVVAFSLIFTSSHAYAIEIDYGAETKNHTPGLSIYAAESKTASNRAAAATRAVSDGAQAEKTAKIITITAGVYSIKPLANPSLRINIEKGSLSSGAKAKLKRRSSKNSQKFRIIPAKSGYCRIELALGHTSIATDGSNVRMKKSRNISAQFWKPVSAGDGVAFINKKTGKQLGFSRAKTGTKLKQLAATGTEQLVTWKLSKTRVNHKDVKAYRSAISRASGSGLRVSNGVAGYSISKKRWHKLKRAIRNCQTSGARVGFIMVDCNTGLTISYHPNRGNFGASTVKGLYLNYLFQKKLEKGTLRWSDISSLARAAIVHSDNGAYRSIRARFGSLSGFTSWLAQAGVSAGQSGGLNRDIWGTYSAKTLAKAWTPSIKYLASGGKYVKKWKNLFRHSDHSFIHEGLRGRSKTYTKPGWMEVGTWCGTIMNDAGIVSNSHGRYLLSFMTTVNPSTNRHKLAKVVRALDDIHRHLPV